MTTGRADADRTRTSIPAPGGEVLVADDDERQIAYDLLHYAPCRRVGDVLYISGVLVRAAAGEGDEQAAFAERLRRAFRRLQATLQAAGAQFDDVALINSFHVWDHPHFRGNKAAHVQTFAAVKDEFIRQPYPAWTAVGVSELIEDGNVEIQLVAHLPAGPA